MGIKGSSLGGAIKLGQGVFLPESREIIELDGFTYLLSGEIANSSDYPDYPKSMLTHATPNFDSQVVISGATCRDVSIFKGSDFSAVTGAGSISGLYKRDLASFAKIIDGAFYSVDSDDLIVAGGSDLVHVSSDGSGFSAISQSLGVVNSVSTLSRWIVAGGASGSVSISGNSGASFNVQALGIGSIATVELSKTHAIAFGSNGFRISDLSSAVWSNIVSVPNFTPRASCLAVDKWLIVGNDGKTCLVYFDGSYEIITSGYLSSDLTGCCKVSASYYIVGSGGLVVTSDFKSFKPLSLAGTALSSPSIDGNPERLLACSGATVFSSDADSVGYDKYTPNLYVRVK